MKDCQVINVLLAKKVIPQNVGFAHVFLLCIFTTHTQIISVGKGTILIQLIYNHFYLQNNTSSQRQNCTILHIYIFRDFPLCILYFYLFPLLCHFFMQLKSIIQSRIMFVCTFYGCCYPCFLYI